MSFWARWRDSSSRAARSSAATAAEGHSGQANGGAGATAQASSADSARSAGAHAVEPAEPQSVREVTRERMAESLHRGGHHLLRDEDGELCGLWGSRLFTFALARQSVLQVRGRWSRQGDISRLWEFLDFVNGWNATRPYPKCYVRVHDDGRLHVITETSTFVALGLSDAQLDQALAVGLAAGTAVFDELERHYPDPAMVALP